MLLNISVTCISKFTYAVIHITDYKAECTKIY